MPAIALVVDVVVSDLIGAAVVDSVATVTGSMLLGEIASGAIVGAVGGGISAAVQGGDIWKGIEQGAISGGVSAGITGALEGAGFGDASQVTDPNTGAVVKDSLGNPLMKGNSTGLLGGSELNRALATGLGSAGGAVATGMPLGQALESGAITGLVGYALPGTGELAAAERGLVSSGLKSALGIGAPEQLRGGGSPLITGQAGRRAGTTPGSAALGAALGVQDPGSPLFGSSGDEKQKKSGWNVESLRYMGQPEEASGG